jgi:hypothetical protein
MNVEATKGKYDTAASRWAGVGPYYAMFPTAFATEVVKEYTKPGQTVLDPFAGRATSLFAAASEDRFGIGVEINPVGWVYGKAKLQTARKADVENKLRWIEKKAASYKAEATTLPEFFDWCFCSRAKEYLVAARELLDWRRSKVDWTTMALLMVDLHGKRQSSLSNQMRQTKALSPQYAIRWWKDRGLRPPERDPVEFMLKKIEWRYRKGRFLGNGDKRNRLYLGDSREQLRSLARRSPGGTAKLLFTSPPYHGVTNYFYDQWLRLWLLGGTAEPRSVGNKHKRKFDNKLDYVDMLQAIFADSKRLLSHDAVVYVRTDAREFTYESTLEALERTFPTKKLRAEKRSSPTTTQTALFDSEVRSRAEVDLVMW